MATYYNAEHLKEGEYEMYFHRAQTTIIRVRMESRFASNKHHQVWVQYQPKVNEPKGIEGAWCTCKTGNRTAGRCSHIAAVSLDSIT
jgi:uncharacterized Zn finger protein